MCHANNSQIAMTFQKLNKRIHRNIETAVCSKTMAKKNMYFRTMRNEMQSKKKENQTQMR